MPAVEPSYENAELKQQQVEAWNREHPIGSKVLVTRDNGETWETTVRIEAQLLGGHSPVAWIDGFSGCYAISRLTAVPADAMDKFRNSVGFQFNFVLYSGLDVKTAIDHVCAAAKILLASRWLEQQHTTAATVTDNGYVKRLENAFLMIYDLAGIDASLPESERMRELCEVFALVKGQVMERDAERTLYDAEDFIAP